MTRTTLPSHRPLASLLLASLALGGIAQIAGAGAAHAGAPPRQPAASPAPHPGPTYRPALVRCRLDAPELYVTTTASTQTPDQPYRTLRILQGGAWILDEAGRRSTGCLDDGQMSSLESTLVQADFTPPPSQIRCKALPTTTVTVADHARGRKARYSTPCGEPVHESVHALVRAADAAIQAAPEPPHAEPVPEPPHTLPVLPACSFRGRPLYREVQWSAGDESSAEAPRTELVVYPGGGWVYTAEGVSRRGCMERSELATARARLRQTHMKTQAVTGGQCAAVNFDRHRITTARGSVTWEGPCPGVVPHRTVLGVQHLMHRAAGL
jgi:chitodextrinase